MKCTDCKKDKVPGQFKKTMREGKEPAVCNYCKYDKPKREYKDKTIVTVKKAGMYECLCGCGKFFKTTKSNRFISGHMEDVGEIEYSIGETM